MSAPALGFSAFVLAEFAFRSALVRWVCCPFRVGVVWALPRSHSRYDMPLKWFDTRQRFEWSQLASSTRRGTVQCPMPLQPEVFSKQTTWHPAWCGGLARAASTPTERSSSHQSARWRHLRVPTRTPAQRSSTMRLQKVNQFDAHKSRTTACRKLQFIVATSGNGNCSWRASNSLWVSQSSQFLGYFAYIADILTFLLKMLANKGHILCMPLVKSNRATFHAKLPLESG